MPLTVLKRQRVSTAMALWQTPRQADDAFYFYTSPPDGRARRVSLPAVVQMAMQSLPLPFGQVAGSNACISCAHYWIVGICSSFCECRERSWWWWSHCWTLSCALRRRWGKTASNQLSVATTASSGLLSQKKRPVELQATVFAVGAAFAPKQRFAFSTHRETFAEGVGGAVCATFFLAGCSL